MHITRTRARILGGAGITSLATLLPALPANATGVPPITCETSTACVLDYEGPNSGHQGYWMARRSNGSTWVRLTMVAGWDNTNAAPITCATEDSCVISYYSRDFYWMARQAEGSTWVRLTKYITTKQL